MVTRSQKVRLGIFIISALFLLIATLIIIVAPKFFEHRDFYSIGYRGISLTGLQQGGAVKYHGLTVGYVSTIYIDPKDIERVIVEISVDHGTPIKADTYADIELLGITGLKIIELKGGTNQSDYVQPGEFILPGESTTEVITGKAETMMEKAEIMLNNMAILTNAENRETLISLLDNSAKSMAILEKLLSENEEGLTTALSNIKQSSDDFQQLLASSKNTMLEIEHIVKSDSLRMLMANLVEISEAINEANLVGLLEDLNRAMHHTNNMMKDMDSNLSKTWVDFSATMESLRESTEYLNQFSRMITEDPSLLVRGTKPANVPDEKLEK
ncbi:MCE family protein [bacterium]|nr:MCE family protein [bacterium]